MAGDQNILTYLEQSDRNVSVSFNLHPSSRHISNTYSNDMQGIAIPVRETLADDTTLFVQSEHEIEIVCKVVEDFSLVSGLNRNKTEGLWIGKSKH
jgi:hypothetical protein